MDALTSLSTVALVSLFGAISPGPDFCIVFRNSLVYSRKVGIFTVFGIVLSLIIHLSCSLFGVGFLLAQNAFLSNLLKYVGAGYLFYLGVKGIITSFKAIPLDVNDKSTPQSISHPAALKQGFLTNLLNPKAALFFISLFAQFISTTTPTSLRIQYAFVNWSVTLCWFLFLTYLVTGKSFVKKMERFRTSIDRVMGSILILLSLKILFF